MALMKKLAVLVFLLASSFVLAGEKMGKEIEILSPSDGAKVRLLHPLQRDWMTMPWMRSGYAVCLARRTSRCPTDGVIAELIS